MRLRWKLLTVGLAAAALAAAGWYWRTPLVAQVAAWRSRAVPKSADVDDHAGHDHAGHDHGDDAHAESGVNEVLISEQARANLGLRLGEVELTDYTRTVVIPGRIIEQPGHSERRITTTLSGIVTKVYTHPGQSVRPGDPVLDLQPTGEVLTNAQSTLLKTLQDLALVNAELKRLAPLVESGSVPARLTIEKEYERTRLESLKLVQQQELLVRGVSQEQIAEIIARKTLLKEFTLRVPARGETTDGSAGMAPDETVYSVERIDVFPGKLVQPGEELCSLALHLELTIEGQAFERDGPVVTQALQEQWPVTVLFEGDETAGIRREGLKLRYIDNSLDPASRLLRFYIPLRNEVLRDVIAEDGIVYRSWRFKPGQRVRILLPVEKIPERIVLPLDAVVFEGPDAYVYRSNGKLFERVPVVIDQRDPRDVVLKNDGSLFPGDEIAMNQAYQIHLALKQQQGSGVDLHAGHNH